MRTPEFGKAEGRTADPSAALRSGRGQFCLGTLSIVSKMNCHPGRSVPGFPATLHWTGPRVRLSVRERRMKCAPRTSQILELKRIVLTQTLKL